MTNRIQYFEDFILDSMEKGQIDSALSSIRFMNPVRKYDGSPAVLAGVDDKGYIYVATIRFFNKEPVYYTTQRSILSDYKLSMDVKLLLVSVLNYLKTTNLIDFPDVMIWGDALCVGNSENTNGIRTFGANTIHYQMPYENSIGIVYPYVMMWHTFYGDKWRGNLAMRCVENPYNLIADRSIIALDVNLDKMRDSLVSYPKFFPYLKNKFFKDACSFIVKDSRFLYGFPVNLLFEEFYEKKRATYKTQRGIDTFYLSNIQIFDFFLIIPEEIEKFLWQIVKQKILLLDVYENHVYDKFTRTYVKDKQGNKIDCCHEGFVLTGDTTKIKLIYPDFIDNNKGKDIVRIWKE